MIGVSDSPFQHQTALAFFGCSECSINLVVQACLAQWSLSHRHGQDVVVIHGGSESGENPGSLPSLDRN